MVATERKTRPHLELVFADYAFPEGHDCVELVSILPPPLPSIDHLMHFDLCPTFTVSHCL